MQFNNFYQEADVMINNPSFINDINFRTERLRDFRRSIKDAPMPQWMMDNLQTMHDAFPVGTAVRCRSSTNNEDLPGFSGAGLYTSKTQHLDEGHISKSIKQVYASMWNFRAFEERDFYRVDHFIAAMGVLCHPNFEEEKSNGVGISIDPIYKTDSTFYLNTQVGESLITNPDPNSVPEEILLFEDTAQGAGYLVLRLSNLVNPGELVMDQIYLDQMRDYLTVIHDEFALLYNVDGVDGFAMDIEYKVTAQDLLVIKQARPWVSFWADVKANYDLAITEIIDPQSSSTLGNSELITAKVANTGLNNMSDFDLTLIVDGQLIETLIITDTIEPFSDASFQFTIPQDFSTIGDYNISCIVSDLDDEYGNNDTLNSLLSKVHALDGELSFEQLTVLCGDVLEAEVIITNYGETTITDTQIEVVVNGLAVDTMDVTVDVPFEEEESVTINIEDNLQQMNNNITLNLLNVNGQSDGNLSNNSVTSITNLDSDYEIVTLIIDADDYPDETSWEIIDEATNQVVSSGSLSAGTQIFSEDICLNYNSCLSLYVYDSFGDGICCDFGIGFFQVLDASGATIVFNNGEFTSEAQEVFCPNGTGCSFTTDINISNTTSSSADDGSITMYTSSGIDPFLYSINGGQTFVDTNAFGNLAPGNYNIFIQDATGLCSYQETVSIEACEFTSIDITATDATSVVTTDGSIVISPTSGVAPYQYSIDGGQNFVSDNVFLNLPVGPYNIVVEDATAICTYEIGIPIEVDALSIEDEVLSNGIKLYPNPTTNQFTIEIESTSPLSEGIKIEVYDHLGRTIRTDIIEKDGSGKTTIPLNNYASGTYFIKCYNTTLETHFKVIKI